MIVKNNKLNLSDMELFIFDMDGVVYRGSEPVEYAVESINNLNSLNKQIAFFTNNSTLTKKDYAIKLSKMNVSCTTEQIFTSSTISAKSLSQKSYSKATAFVVGEEGIIKALEENNIEVLNRKYDSEEILKNQDITCSFVIAGLDRKLTYYKLAAATQLIARGAVFYATNDDSTFPDKIGFLPGAGTIIKAISTASGSTPLEIFGKPSPAGIFQILKQTNINPSKAIMIGDRPETDILCAKNAGINSALVLTGVISKNKISSIPSQNMPDIILENLAEL